MEDKHFPLSTIGVHKSQAPGHLSNQISYVGPQYATFFMSPF